MPRQDNLSPAGTYALAKNISEVNTTGAELDLHYSRQIMPGHHLASMIGLVWLNSHSSDGSPSFYISSHARFMGNFNIQYYNDLFAFSVTGIYKNRTPRQAHTINANLDENMFMINGKLDVFLLKNRLSVFADVDNIFDNTCQDLLGSQLPGRWLMGGLKWNLE